MVDLSLISLVVNYGLPALILLAVGIGFLKVGSWFAKVAFPAIMAMWKQSIQTQDRANKALATIAEVLEQNTKAFTLIMELLCKEKGEK